MDLEGKVALVDDDPFSLTAWWIFSHSGFFFSFVCSWVSFRVL